MNLDYNGIFGFDISHYQDNNDTAQQIDFNRMKSYGTSFVIIKAGQYNYEDEDFQYNWRFSTIAGIPKASYWFGDGRLEGTKQAQTYYDILQRNGYNGELCAVDYESSSWTDWHQLYNFIAEFQRISNLPSNKIALYTGYYYWLEHCPPVGSSRDWFKQFPLWEAWYTTTPSTVLIPSPWTDCLIWQDGTPAVGLDAGVESKEIDHNMFNGKEDKFKFYFEGNVNNGGNQMVWKEATGNITIRIGPGSTYAKAKIDGVEQYVLTGDKVELLEESNGWGHISRIYRNDVPVDVAPISWCGTAYLKDTVYTPPVDPNPSTELPSVLIGYDSDGIAIPNAIWDLRNVS